MTNDKITRPPDGPWCIAKHYAREHAAAWGLYTYPETLQYQAEGRRLTQLVHAKAREAGQAYEARKRDAGKEFENRFCFRLSR